MSAVADVRPALLEHLKDLHLPTVVDNPVFVGCHYFKYADEPLTGRPGDGENYSIGFTTVVDGLYPEMVEAAKKVSGEMYQRRSR